MNRESATPRCFVAAAAVLIAALPAVAADAAHPWGPTVNGLRMSVALVPDSVQAGTGIGRHYVTLHGRRLSAWPEAAGFLAR